MAARKRRASATKSASRSSTKAQKATIHYKAAPGTIFTDKDIEKIMPSLLKLLTRDGGKLTKGAVLEEAQNPRSPLHRYFEWDDEAAANKYRLVQAQRIIKAVQYEIKTGKVTVNVPALHKVISTKENLPYAEPGPGYVLASTAVEEGDFRDQILQGAAQDAQLFRSRYQKFAKMFHELEPVLRAMGELEKVVSKKRPKAAA